MTRKNRKNRVIGGKITFECLTPRYFPLCYLSTKYPSIDFRWTINNISKRDYEIKIFYHTRSLDEAEVKKIGYTLPFFEVTMFRIEKIGDQLDCINLRINDGGNLNNIVRILSYLGVKIHPTLLHRAQGNIIEIYAKFKDERTFKETLTNIERIATGYIKLKKDQCLTFSRNEDEPFFGFPTVYSLILSKDELKHLWSCIIQGEPDIVETGILKRTIGFIVGPFLGLLGTSIIEELRGKV